MLIVPGGSRTLALLAALTVLGAGCGGGDDGPDRPDGEPASDGRASPFDRDACELLSRADARELLGAPVEGAFTEGDESSSTPGQCEWAATGEGGTGGAARSAAIQLLLGDEQIFENTRIIAEGGDDYEAVDEVGDEAYAGSGQGGVLIGDAGIAVTPLGASANDPATHELIVDILTRVAGNY